MNSRDAARLLQHASAFDNRQPSEAAATAWAAALHDMPCDDDTLAAVARFYGTPPARPGERLWIQPHDVRTHRQAIRTERLEGFVYEPVNGDENPQQYLANLRAQREAVASGRRPANPAVAALGGGPHPSVLPALEGAVRLVPDEAPARKPGPLGVECPTCKARIGRHCQWPGGTRRPTHGARKRAANGEAPTTPDDTAERRAASAAALAQLTDEQRQQLDAMTQQPAQEH